MNRWHAALRPCPSKLPPLECTGHFVVTRVTDAGTIRFRSRLSYLASVLDTHYIGLEEVDDDIWSIYFHTVLFATFDERDPSSRADRRVKHVAGPKCRSWFRMFKIAPADRCATLNSEHWPSHNELDRSDHAADQCDGGSDSRERARCKPRQVAERPRRNPR
jgi:hypothetical protein